MRLQFVISIFYKLIICPVVGASVPSVAKWILAIIAFVGAGVQIFGFLGVFQVCHSYSYDDGSVTNLHDGEDNPKTSHQADIYPCEDITKGIPFSHRFGSTGTVVRVRKEVIEAVVKCGIMS